MLHIIDDPMQLIHADVVDLNFLSKSPVAPKYCLVCVDMFTSSTYTCSMKKKNQLADKLRKLLSETQELRKYLIKEGRGELRLQTDQEFNHNEIKQITKKYNVVHFNNRLNDGPAVRAEQKIRKLKSRLKNFKRVLSSGKLKPNEALKKAIKNMNIFPTRKYGVPPKEIEKKSLASEK